MINEILKVISDLSNRFAESQKTLNDILDAKCVRNENDIAEAKELQIQTEQTITDMDLQNIEAEQMITEMDLRLMELEG